MLESFSKVLPLLLLVLLLLLRVLVTAWLPELCDSELVTDLTVVSESLRHGRHRLSPRLRLSS